MIINAPVAINYKRIERIRRMDQQSINSISTNSPSANNSIPSTNSQHYLADIKYPNIPDFISLEKIFNVLEKIRTTSRPLTYKWQSLTQPKRTKYKYKNET